MATPKTIAFHTLGCKLNFSETSSIRRKFESLGYSPVDWEEPADIYILNTCSVTEFADRKCRAAVRKALRCSPDARIIVMGCYAQLKPAEIAEIEGVDLVLGAAEKFNVHHYVEGLSKTSDKAMIKAGDIVEVNSFEESFSFGDRTRTFLKIQDGCDYKCSFCTIPLARGKSRNPTVENIVAQAEELASRGISEVVLTGVNIGDFGKSSNGLQKKETFLDLIKALDKLEGINRFRISSIEPNLCSDEVIKFVAHSNKFVPHFHMPLQSGSDEILRSMRRRYKKELYSDRVSEIKTIMPHACIGVDVIVGFPGEKDHHFMETYDFLSMLEISYLHVFTYSERANTLAAQLPGSVPMETRRRRNAQLRNLSQKKKLQFYRQFVGETRLVLIEESKSLGKKAGFTDNYLKVDLDDIHQNLHLNTIVPVHLSHITKGGVLKGLPEQVLA